MVTTSDGYQFWLSIAKPATTSPDLKVLQGVRLSDSSVCYALYYAVTAPSCMTRLQERTTSSRFSA
jgi:hypothetical protein